ncbi:MAG TPA: NAD(P)H-binding protein, partial [Polyangiaceae bacterium]|nr:NAD(P)H-binding protein [Polyangiaceae bacterium]
MAPQNDAAFARILVVGATGHLGGKVTRMARQSGFRVRALVRASSDASALAASGVDVMRGDMLDRPSLDRAMQGCAAVVSTAIGYAGRKPGDLRGEADTLGNRHLADAALAAGVRRLVFCSVLTCDGAKDVPHFWNKKLAEDYFEERRLPFVALRPGAFLDQGPND